MSEAPCENSLKYTVYSFYFYTSSILVWCFDNLAVIGEFKLSLYMLKVICYLLFPFVTYTDTFTLETPVHPGPGQISSKPSPLPVTPDLLMNSLELKRTLRRWSADKEKVNKLRLGFYLTDGWDQACVQVELFLARLEFGTGCPRIFTKTNFG